MVNICYGADAPGVRATAYGRDRPATLGRREGHASIAAVPPENLTSTGTASVKAPLARFPGVPM